MASPGDAEGITISMGELSVEAATSSGENEIAQYDACLLSLTRGQPCALP
jgi:hypothetical protein